MHKSVEIELVLCQMRRPDVTELLLRRKGLQDSDVGHIGAGLTACVARYVNPASLFFWLLVSLIEHGFFFCWFAS
jgi:hypothetical protein